GGVRINFDQFEGPRVVCGIDGISEEARRLNLGSVKGRAVAGGRLDQANEGRLVPFPPLIQKRILHETWVRPQRRGVEGDLTLSGERGRTGDRRHQKKESVEVPFHSTRSHSRVT